ncbi:hypothetical protein [Pseudogemmobacter faecipullorum]|uniref:Uncharacterized protein n=1 Tax=Pseudogemmobacter faecipullorum TaxID=2755041 RepID=A0ABS8CR12_9RHOB|nr:hypothetical protein [Pseudogemmobacter faecipullorum]MCB5411803.1 hypothetical protein [Pseudogemmobacter faecipullorum]
MIEHLIAYQQDRKGSRPHRGKEVTRAEFARLWHDMSLKMDDLAAALGISAKAVQMRAKARGLPSRSVLRGAARDHFDSEFPALWVFGVTAEEIALHYGVTVAAVHMKAHRMGMSAAGRGISRHRPGRTIADYREFQLAAAMARTAAAESRAAAEHWRQIA